MIEFKVADAKHFCRGAENCRRRAGVDGAAELRAATLRCERSLRELEASWSFRGDTGAARRAPPSVWRDKKEKGGRAENIVRVYVKADDAALSESNGG